MRATCIWVVACFPALLRAADPYTVTARLERAGAAWQVSVAIDAPSPWHVYADNRFDVSLDGHTVTGRCTPPPVSMLDPLGARDSVFTGRVTCAYALDTDDFPVRVRVKHQACSDTSCLPPRTSTFLLSTNSATVLASAPAAGTPWLNGVQVKTTAAGYLNARDFLAFLARARGATTPLPPGRIRQFLDDPNAFFARQGFAWTLLLMLLGGLLLNLTPCVLPMIPINLAIIGAGARAGSRRRGFTLGAAYGAGIAIVYGALGMVVVLTGSVFGALQSSPLFNGVLAALFVVLALAMFDVVPIDLARFQRGGGTGGFWAAGVAGGVSALLAGACVAPVVAAVLLLAGTLYQGGNTAAALLPFVLGIGMALPWPLAGAGLAVLPKPGAWMLGVKYGFGVLIAAMGIYYGWLTYEGLATRTPAAAQGTELVAGDMDGWRKRLAEAKVSGKPLLLDFHASWCKSCHVMDRTTFRDPTVRQAMKAMILVRVAAERPDEEPTAGMLRAFGVSGLPAFAVVTAQ